MIRQPLATRHPAVQLVHALSLGEGCVQEAFDVNRSTVARFIRCSLAPDTIALNNVTMVPVDHRAESVFELFLG
jgi:hypothetical protein